MKSQVAVFASLYVKAKSRLLEFFYGLKKPRRVIWQFVKHILRRAMKSISISSLISFLLSFFLLPIHIPSMLISIHLLKCTKVNFMWSLTTKTICWRQLHCIFSFYFPLFLLFTSSSSWLNNSVLLQLPPPFCITHELWRIVVSSTP